jgi:adenylate kinase
MAVVCITGTPCTGKTTLAKLIEENIHFKRLDVNKFIEQKHLCDDYDKERNCKIIDTEKFNKEIIKIIQETKENIIIDSHFSHVIPKEHVDLCIITKCDLKVLKERLEARKYSEAKVRENLDAEIFDNCLTQAEEQGQNILIIDTTKGVDEEVIERVKERLNMR